MGKTLYEKVWDKHVVGKINDKTDLLYVDLHLMHEVTSPQAFDVLRERKVKVRKPDLVLATMDHQVPTHHITGTPALEIAKLQMEALERNVKEFGIKKFYSWGTEGQGIIHAVGPQTGAVQPGMTIVCGDSHTATHGAFAAIAFGIGTSEVAHVLETQCLMQSKAKTMAITVNNKLKAGVTPKDLILHILRILGTEGGVGYAIEFRGEGITSLSMDGRQTICNMTIEGGGRVGMIAPDEKTFEFLKGREFAPQGENFEKAVSEWKKLYSDTDAKFDKEIIINAEDVAPCITWGTTPAQVVEIDGVVPTPKNKNEQKALDYMGLTAGQKMKDIPVDVVFIGSCTNGRLEDLRAAANIAKGYKVKSGIRALVVPGSMKIKAQAEKEGLDKIFVDAGFEWRFAGCSMCLGMNEDTLGPKERSASTSNRNFESRQGKDGRTHLVSPEIAVATAILGHFATPSDLK